MKSINSNIPQLVSLLEEKGVYIKKLIGGIVLSVAGLLHAENTIASNIEFYLTNSSATGTSKVGKLNNITTATGGKLIVTDQSNKLVTNKLVAFTTPYGTLTIDTLYVAGVPNPNLGNFTFSLATQSVAYLNSLPPTIAIPITYRTINASGTMVLNNDVINLNLATLTQNPTNGIVNVDMNYADVESTNNVFSGVLPEITANTKQILKYSAWAPTGKGSLDLSPANQGYGIYGYNAPTKTGDPTKLDYTVIGKQTHRYSVTDSIDGVNTGSVKIGTIVVNIINGKPIDTITPITTYSSVLTKSKLAVNNPEKKEPIIYFPETGTTTNGTKTINADGTFTYKSNPGFVGIDSFTYKIQDEAGQQANGTINITVNPNTPQIGSNLTSTTYIGTDRSSYVEVASNPENETFTYAVLSQPSSGNVIMNPDGTFTYTPIAGFYGTVTATYQITDEAGNTGTGTINIDVYDTIVISWSQPTQRENGDALTISEIGGEELRYRKLSDTNTYQYLMLEKTTALGSTDPISDPSKNTLRYYNEHIENGAGCYRIVSSTVTLPLDIDKTTFQIAAYDTNGLYSNFVDLTPGDDSDSGFIECSTK